MEPESNLFHFEQIADACGCRRLIYRGILWSYKNLSLRECHSVRACKNALTVSTISPLSPQRPKTGSRSPRAWCPSGVREMLRNEKYRGVDLWNRTHKLRNPEGGRIET